MPIRLYFAGIKERLHDGEDVRQSKGMEAKEFIEFLEGLR